MRQIITNSTPSQTVYYIQKLRLYENRLQKNKHRNRKYTINETHNNIFICQNAEKCVLKSIFKKTRLKYTTNYVSCSYSTKQNLQTASDHVHTSVKIQVQFATIRTVSIHDKRHNK